VSGAGEKIAMKESVKRALSLLVAAVILALGGCEAIQGALNPTGPFLYESRIYNEYLESIFSVDVRAGNGEWQNAMTDARIGQSTSQQFEYTAMPEDQIEFRITTTSLGQQYEFSFSFDTEADVPGFLRYKYDVATGSFVVYW
jgi:hypothetical protein